MFNKNQTKIYSAVARSSISDVFPQAHVDDILDHKRLEKHFVTFSGLHSSQRFLEHQWHDGINVTEESGKAEYSYWPPQGSLKFRRCFRPLPEPIGSRFPCPDCNKMFASAGSRSNHITAIHAKQTFSCVCGKSYPYSQNLLRHKRSCAVCVVDQSA